MEKIYSLILHVIRNLGYAIFATTTNASLKEVPNWFTPLDKLQLKQLCLSFGRWEVFRYWPIMPKVTFVSLQLSILSRRLNNLKNIVLYVRRLWRGISICKFNVVNKPCFIVKIKKIAGFKPRILGKIRLFLEWMEFVKLSGLEWLRSLKG
jgi:hypothetical protein